jgi:hypothetical protein
MDVGESAAMWEIYGGRDYGVAIESTYRRLTKAFVIEENDARWLGDHLMTGVVHYLDPETEGLAALRSGKVPNAFEPLMWKRPPFSFEQELRVVYHPNPGSIVGAAFAQGALDGHRVPVDVNTLIERVVLAPGAPDWQCELLKLALPDLEVRFSRLDDDPASGKPREVMKPGWIRFGSGVGYPQIP